MQVNINFSVSLIQEPESNYLLDIISNSKVCLNMNAIECYCSPVTFQFTKLRLTKQCIDEYDSFWSSISIYKDEMYSISNPILVPAVRERKSSRISKISLVLPLFLDDLSRASILLWSLRNIDSTLVDKLFIFVPDKQLEIITDSLNGAILKLSFKTEIFPESILFKRTKEKMKNV